MVGVASVLELVFKKLESMEYPSITTDFHG